MMKYLTEPEQRELLKAAKSQIDTLAQRDYHWMAALILTGMRIAEFGRLTVPVVKQGLATGWLISRKEHCKGRLHANDYVVTAQLRLHLSVLVGLSDHFGEGLEAPDAGQPLVWGRVGYIRPRTAQPKTGIQLAGPDAGPADHAALSVRSYEARLKLWARAAGLDSRISPHWLRHTRGMNVIKHCRGENPLLVAQRALNHTSLKSTGIYLHMSREQLASELQLVDSRGRMAKADARKLAGARS